MQCCCKVSETGRGLGHLREFVRCTHFCGNGFRHFTHALLEYAKNALEQSNTLFTAGLRVAFKGVAGGGNRQINILCVTEGDGRNSLFGGRVDHVHALSAPGLNPLAINIELLVVTHYRLAPCCTVRKFVKR